MEEQIVSPSARPGKLNASTLWAIAIIVGINFISGAIYAVWGWAASPEMTAPHIVLKAHGISGIALQILLGFLIACHMQPAARARRNVASGLALASPLVLLVLSGAGLYYAGNESVRELCRWVHVCIGMMLPLPLVIHVALRNRAGE